MSTPSETSITQWLERIQQGPNNSAAQHLCERYCQRLAEVAKKRLMSLGMQCRAEDEADAVQEPFAAFFRRVEQRAYPDCHDRNDLWCLLVKIADKARQLARGERRRKRGGGKVRGDSA